MNLGQDKIDNLAVIHWTCLADVATYNFYKCFPCYKEGHYISPSTWADVVYEAPASCENGEIFKRLFESGGHY